jgi:hypothetical protein
MINIFPDISESPTKGSINSPILCRAHDQPLPVDSESLTKGSINCPIMFRTHDQHLPDTRESPTKGYNVPSALYDPNMRIAVHAWRDFYARSMLLFENFFI